MISSQIVSMFDNESVLLLLLVGSTKSAVNSMGTVISVTCFSSGEVGRSKILSDLVGSLVGGSFSPRTGDSVTGNFVVGTGASVTGALVVGCGTGASVVATGGATGAG